MIVEDSTLSSVSNEIGDDLNFILHQNYPNPFNPDTEISFTLKEDSFTNLSVYNTLGEKISTLVNEFINAGKKSIKYNASGLSSGIYYYVLTTDQKSISRKMVLLK
jgi:hypothetical protein